MESALDSAFSHVREGRKRTWRKHEARKDNEVKSEECAGKCLADHILLDRRIYDVEKPCRQQRTQSGIQGVRGSSAHSGDSLACRFGHAHCVRWRACIACARCAYRTRERTHVGVSARVCARGRAREGVRAKLCARRCEHARGGRPCVRERARAGRHHLLEHGDAVDPWEVHVAEHQREAAPTADDLRPHENMRAREERMEGSVPVCVRARVC
eukprot:4221986-Pleurochrysis_carterae.AAC.1